MLTMRSTQISMRLPMVVSLWSERKMETVFLFNPPHGGKIISSVQKYLIYIYYTYKILYRGFDPVCVILSRFCQCKFLTANSSDNAIYSRWFDKIQ